MSLSSKWQPSQQRHAAARSTVPSRKSATEAAIQLLLPVLGSTAVVAVAVLGLEDVDTVVLVTVVVVLVVAVAGFSAGFAVGPVVSSPAAGLASAGDLLELSPGTLSPSVAPAGGIHHATSTKGPASRRHKPRRHKRPARARNTAVGTGGIEHDASAESRRPAAPSPRPASC